ncbi:C-type lectin domain family 4 member M-like [Huso huso]|uniref:C-type lectin domain family 4 member M-like n=1 Tax=Huso huso TaxID=61971 RepID=A0ABR0YA28_HUSHU
MAQENIYGNISTVQHQMERIRQESNFPAETFGHGISDQQAIYNKFDIDDEQRKNGTKGFIVSRCIVSAVLVVLALMLAAVFSFTFVKYSEMSATIQRLDMEVSLIRENGSSQMRKVESDILQLKTEGSSQMQKVESDILQLKSEGFEVSLDVKKLERNISQLKDADVQIWTDVQDLEKAFSSLRSQVCDFRTCPCDWKEFSGKCYYFSKGERDWQKAKDFCYNQDAVLAMVKTQQELNYIGSQVSTDHHLGLSDLESESNWKWLDRSSVAGSFWNSGEPNNANEEDCGEITAGKLNDITCSIKQRWICEKTL